MVFRVFILILVLAAAAFSQVPVIEPGVSHDLAKWRASHYSDVRYKLNLRLEKMSPVLKGTIEIRLQEAAVACAEPNCPPMAIILDWRKIKGSENLSTISNVSINGKQATTTPSAEAAATPPKQGGEFYFEERSEHLIFRDGVKLGENVIKLDFTSPILTSGSAITRYVDKEDGAEYIYSLFVPSDASTAFPVFDQPDLKARFSLLALTSEQDWSVVSNNRQLRRISGECFEEKLCTKSFIFPETQPISTYVFAFAAGPFERTSECVSSPHVSKGSRSDKEPLLTCGLLTPETGIYVRKSQTAKFKPHAAEVARLRDAAVSYLESYFDYKFPFPKYDIVLIPEFPFGGMEHAGATFLREDRVIFPQEPTANDYITRANVIFHETAHQWFGDTVTMKWFDDLWLKEGFAEFMAYKTLEKVMPEYNAWKVFYERNKQAAYLTDSTKGTTPIYQEIANLSAAKSAYGNIVYRKAPSFLRQAEFYLGEQKFQTAVRAFLKKHEYANAGWEDLVKEFEAASGKDLKEWATEWVTKPGMFVFSRKSADLGMSPFSKNRFIEINATHIQGDKSIKPRMKFKILVVSKKGERDAYDLFLKSKSEPILVKD
ncbi:MAG: M1 family aminopeptidase, partial [Pyrinomonadaceae bacterium]